MKNLALVLALITALFSFNSFANDDLTIDGKVHLQRLLLQGKLKIEEYAKIVGQESTLVQINHLVPDIEDKEAKAERLSELLENDEIDIVIYETLIGEKQNKPIQAPTLKE